MSARRLVFLVQPVRRNATCAVHKANRNLFTKDNFRSRANLHCFGSIVLIVFHLLTPCLLGTPPRRCTRVEITSYESYSYDVSERSCRAGQKQVSWDRDRASGLRDSLFKTSQPKLDGNCLHQKPGILLITVPGAVECGEQGVFFYVASLAES